MRPIENMDLNKITSPFGWRIHPIYKDKRFHNGIDYPAQAGTKVLACADALVVVSKMQNGGKGLGNYVVLMLSDGTYAMHAHLQARLVQNGQRVKEGQTIGLVGSTGDSTGPHLHFGVCTNYVANNVTKSAWIDPMPLLKEDFEMITETKIVVNGETLKVKRILKDGENYIRLRDFDDVLHICKVDYDQVKKLPKVRK